MLKFHNGFYVGRCMAESFKDALDIGSWLHGDDSKLVLFIDPDQESLLFVVEDASAVGPVIVESTSL